ncbi:MAG: N-acetylmuramoyl-L-alanine amidase [Syntrophobacterales bacterium]|nr:N-acetylmuramoyl-L-alanine amidase [Syntrophobacterales bacterium]
MSSFKKIVLGLFFFLLSPGCAFATTEILNIRHWVAPENTRIVIDTDEEADTVVSRTDQTITLDFKDTEISDTVPSEEILNKPGIKKIVVVPLPDNSVRVQLQLADYVETRVFKLKAVADKSFRVVVDIALPEMEKKEREERKQQKILKKDKIIVIDAGHGGDDPGAVGWRKTKEKEVVLKIAQRLQKILDKKQGYRAFLTRRGDYYPSFKKRIQIAREYGADLFLSIHADAARNKSARGSSVYCLSTTGASSVAARLLASKENLADIIGGAENDQGNDESDPITLHMVQTEAMNLSRNLAASILKQIKAVNPLKFEQVQYAPFLVLKTPEIPSVLVETAYISNPREEMLLRSPSFQTKIAEAIAAAVDETLTGRKIPPVTIAATVQSEKANPSPDRAKVVEPTIDTVLYKVKKGDHLEKIAKMHGTTVAVLLKLNGMKADGPLYAGSNIKVPAVKKEGEAEKVAQKRPSVQPLEYSFYTVRKGDTLEKIATRNKTTVAVLLRLNNMKLRDPLYVNLRLKVPAASGRENAETVSTKKTREAEPSKPLYYRVKKGDTIERIAKRHDISTAALLKANGMKLKDPLYVGRKLKIP